MLLLISCSDLCQAPNVKYYYYCHQTLTFVLCASANLKLPGWYSGSQFTKFNLTNATSCSFWNSLLLSTIENHAEVNLFVKQTFIKHLTGKRTWSLTWNLWSTWEMHQPINKEYALNFIVVGIYSSLEAEEGNV